MTQMPTDLPTPIALLLQQPEEHLAGTDGKLTLPLTRSLLNEVLAARPADTPVRELYIDPEAGNRFRVHLSAVAPVVGTVSRRITFVPGPPVTFPDQPWLHFRITEGFRFLDKPLLNLMRSQIEARLPRGIELTGDHLRLHVPALLTKAGYRSLVPLIRELRITSEANRLVVQLHLAAGPDRNPKV